MLILILQSVYLMLPAYFANMAPVFFRKINFLDYPIDFNKKLKNKEILGKHKTFRGVLFGVLLALIISYIQYSLYRLNFFKNISILNYSNWVLIGFLLGFGALFGDLVKSFFKRRFEIPSGKPWIPFDEIDFVIVALAFISFYKILIFEIYLAILIASPLLHILINHIAYYTKIREGKW